MCPEGKHFTVYVENNSKVKRVLKMGPFAKICQKCVTPIPKIFFAKNIKLGTQLNCIDELKIILDIKHSSEIVPYPNKARYLVI